MIAQPFRTARLDLVPLRADHAEEMHDVLSDPALHTFIGGAPEDLRTLQARYERMAAGSPDPAVTWLNWVISLRDERRLTGTIQATITTSHAPDASTPGSSTAGPTMARPSTPGPPTAGPSAAAPASAERPAADLSAAGPSAAGPSAAGPSAAGRSAAGPPAAGVPTVAFRAGLSTAEIAWVVGTPWQGRGIATEAVRGLVGWLSAQPVREIVAHIHPRHHASAAVGAAAGLTPTAERQDGEVRWRRRLAASHEGVD